MPTLPPSAAKTKEKRKKKKEKRKDKKEKIKMADHWFWLIISLACIGWYLVITGYIAWKGLTDIRTMLSKIKDS
jgi:hypothetical protein